MGVFPRENSFHIHVEALAKTLFLQVVSLLWLQGTSVLVTFTNTVHYNAFYTSETTKLSKPPASHCYLKEETTLEPPEEPL